MMARLSRVSRAARTRRVAVFATLAILVAGGLLVPAAVGGRTQTANAPLPTAAFSPLVASGTDVQINVAVLPAREDPGHLDSGASLTEPGAVAAPSQRPQPSSPPQIATTQVIVTPRPTPRATPRPAPAATPRPAPARPAPTPRAVGTVSTAKGYTLSGWASWYDNGTTAMRLPRGTRVRICGPASCVNRIVNDYGPDASVFPERIVDMMPTDFATVCGCSPSKGTVRVTVTVYT